MVEKVSRNKQIPDIVPDGVLVNRAWFAERGANRPDVDYYLRVGALKAVARGVYRRPGPPLPWESVVSSLSGLGYQAHLGGTTALDLQGFSHFVRLADVRTIALYSHETLPKWLAKWHQTQPGHGNPFCFELFKYSWLKTAPSDFLTSRSRGHWNWNFQLAMAELALFEVLYALETEADFQQVDRAFESFSGLRPQLLQSLLLQCPSIKARRLFGWFAERHHHAWFDRIDWHLVDFGSGKRSLIKGGRYDSKWRITVPRNLESEMDFRGDA